MGGQDGRGGGGYRVYDSVLDIGGGFMYSTWLLAQCERHFDGQPGLDSMAAFGDADGVEALRNGMAAVADSFWQNDGCGDWARGQGGVAHAIGGKGFEVAIATAVRSLRPLHDCSTCGAD